MLEFESLGKEKFYGGCGHTPHDLISRLKIDIMKPYQV
jgi:hypothetical protein